MDIYQTVISHYPHWSKIELIAVVIVMIISFIILERFYKKDKINKIQMFFCIFVILIPSATFSFILFIIYLLHVYGSTVFSRLPSKRICKLEVFWSWKEILNSMNTTYPKYELFLENILNVIMLLPLGIFLPLVYGKKIDWKVGLLIGFCISFSIELMQLILCRGMFDVDDIIHNSLGFLIGIVITNKVLLMNKIN